MITLPHNGWKPRPYQMPLWNYLEGGGKRAVAVWHRRAGKDELTLHWAAMAAMREPGTYWHMLPKKVQSRTAIWDAVNPLTGQRRIDDAFPKEIRRSTNDSKMMITLRNNSTWQVLGSDVFDNLVGSPPRGIIFSEWSLAKPAVWALLEPILIQNGGWSFFIFTARGHNHGHAIYQEAMQNNDWFGELLTPDDTGIFTPEQLEDARGRLHRLYGEEDGEAFYQREYWCSFDTAVMGAYYAREIQQAEREGRICAVPYDPSYPVDTWWDIGITDSTVIWFTQKIGREIRVIDCQAGNSRAFPEYVKLLHKLGYTYGRHMLPHDGAAQQFSTGKSIQEQGRKLGVRFDVCPKLPVQQGINAVRAILPKCVFDAQKCADGLGALRQYQRKYDENKRAYSKTPLHDWTSDYADAFRYFAVGYHERPTDADDVRQLPIFDRPAVHPGTQGFSSIWQN